MQVTEQFDIIVVGAGAAGLMAATEFTQVKLKTLLLEAQERVGGRMCTNVPANFTRYIEQGAEFVHGEAPLTISLLKEAKVDYTEMSGNVYQSHNGTVAKEDFFDNDWHIVIERLHNLKDDMTMSSFLTMHFPEAKFEELKRDVQKFVEGYNAADISKVSAFALRDEWSQEEDPSQYRINGGYCKLYDFLKSKIETQGGVIKLGQSVTVLRWSKGEVEVQTTNNSYKARKVILTIPISLLKKEAIKFEPAIPTVQVAAEKVGFGGVIKINIEFRKAFWETETKRKFKNIQFLFTEEEIPTWWSQYPDETSLLTGWLGGPQSERKNWTNDDVFKHAITSLANAMDYPVSRLKDEVIAYHVDQWVDNEFSGGAYSYEMVGTQEAIKVLQQPIEDTIYLAGEAIYNGPYKGTVEAALTSGKDCALRVNHDKNLFR